ncbi:MAG: hypothetical protein JXR61_06480 [Prolixibacteraceae bacterium]|nr:hypothetical protein [Prolixibacteraceae bacterium]
MENIKNSIDKVLVDINTIEINNANTLKNNIRLFLEQEIFPAIESLVNRLNMQQKIVRLENVSIDFAVNVKDDLITVNSAAVSLLENQLKNQIIEKTGEAAGALKLEKIQVNEIPKQENLEEIFLFFLAKGYYPWYGERSHIEEFIQEEIWAKSLKNNVFINKLVKELKDKRVFQRFVYQYPFLIVFSFLSKVTHTELETHIPGNDKFYYSPLKTIYLNTLFILHTERKEEIIIDYLTDWANQLYENNSDLGFELNHNILKSISKQVINNSKIQNLLNRMLDYKSETRKINRKKETDFLIRKKEITVGNLAINNDDTDLRFFENGINEIRVQNAGLVIIHPFLKQLFSTLKFIDNKNHIVPDKQNQAVQLLHFISTGNEEFWEGDMVFEKFLAGMPLNVPLLKESILNTEMKQKAENLLIEVVKKWPALKNTSTVGLRQLFFQREGKLIKRERNYKLIVERKAQDVLLDKLDWNLSFIRIPWMKKEMLYVEW